MILFLGLTACANNDQTELDAFIQRVKTSKKVKLAPMPKLNLPRSFRYGAQELNSPFDRVISSDLNRLQPDQHREKMPLEKYPLDGVKMVGILSRDNQMLALVEVPDGTVHTLSLSEYVGLNYGQVIRIAPKEIEIKEKVLNRWGGWEERTVSLKLSINTEEE